MSATHSRNRPVPGRHWQLTRRRLGLALVLLLLTVLSPARIAANPASAPDFTQLSLEELMSLEVTSVTKKPQRLNASAAAIFVITQDDLRRSGVTHLPEALRMVPGLQVARIDANKWAISARGYNGRFANKLLVLMDGRTLYTPLFSGVYWEVQDTLLEDIERIEVIRGPGATLWGANAVNGIINIITKHARDTQGGLVSLGGGTEVQGSGSVRFGTEIAPDAFFRIYLKYFNHDQSVDAAGTATHDDWFMVRGGFRLDWQASPDDTLTLQGDLYAGEANQDLALPLLTPPFMQRTEEDIQLRGGNLLSRWHHQYSKTSNVNLQLYYDRTHRQEEALYDEKRDTVDLDVSHQFRLGLRHDIVWGLGYRFTQDNFSGSAFTMLNPDQRTTHLFSAFVQDEITLINDHLVLTLGSKFEHNDYSGFEYQPNIRLSWTPNAHHTIWGAVSRAVRTPSREDDARANRFSVPPGTPGRNPGPLPALVSVFGSRDFKSETLLAYELGYRLLITEHLSFDIATFYNDYDNLRTTEPGTPFVEATPLPPHLVTPLILDNKAQGESYGVEVAVDWHLLPWWRLHVAYTYFNIDIDFDRDSQRLGADVEAGQSPHHQVSLRSVTTLPHDVEFDLWFRYVDKLPTLNVKSYVTLDARLSWRPIPHLELSLVGQNLIEPRHLEFVQELFPVATEIERSIYGKLSWHF